MNVGCGVVIRVGPVGDEACAAMICVGSLIRVWFGECVTIGGLIRFGGGTRIGGFRGLHWVRIGFFNESVGRC